MSAPLAGVAVLVTRPAAQAGGLCQALEARGAQVLPLPTIEIAPAPASPRLDQALAAAATADWWFFVSTNAVQHGLAALAARGLAAAATTQVVAVGPATAGALEQAGVAVALVPEAGFDSEAVLALAPLAKLSGATVAIFRGNGGRELFAREVARRGARVVDVQVYRRRRPRLDAAPVLERWAAAPRRAAVVTSAEGLTNLMSMAAARRGLLMDSPLVTVSQRVAEAAAAAGCRRPRVAPSPTDAGLLQALVDEFEEQE